MNKYINSIWTLYFGFFLLVLNSCSGSNEKKDRLNELDNEAYVAMFSCKTPNANSCTENYYNFDPGYVPPCGLSDSQTVRCPRTEFFIAGCKSEHIITEKYKVKSLIHFYAGHPSVDDKGDVQNWCSRVNGKYFE